MLPQMRHIQRLEVDEQVEHDDIEVEGFAKGIARAEEEVVG